MSANEEARTPAWRTGSQAGIVEEGPTAWSVQIAAHVERLHRAEVAALETICQAAWDLTDPEKRDRLEVMSWSGTRPPPRTVACMTDDAYQRHNLSMLVADYEREHGELAALGRRWL